MRAKKLALKIPSISIFLKDWSWSRHTEKLQYSNFFQGLILKGFTELINFVLWWLFIEGKKWSQRWLSLKHDFHWKKRTFDGGRPFMEDDLWCKMTFGGRWPSMEDDLRWKTTLDGRRPLMKDNLWWKTTYDGSHLMMEDDLWWKTTYDKRRQWRRP